MRHVNVSQITIFLLDATRGQLYQGEIVSKIEGTQRGKLTVRMSIK